MCFIRNPKAKSAASRISSEAPAVANPIAIDPTSYRVVSAFANSISSIDLNEKIKVKSSVNVCC